MLERDYQGLAIHAAGNAHGEVAEKLAEFVAPPARVLDIAAGSGALSARLRDSGYAVIANDIDRAQFEPREIDCLSVDLNLPDFGSSLAGPYDAIVAVEIIEHLESPAAFMRGCAQLLEPDGRLIISTPNVESAASRMHFLRTGRLNWFGPESALGAEGHISPQFPWFIEAHARRARLEIVDEWCSDMALFGRPAGSWKTRIFYSHRMLRWIERHFDAGGGDVRFFALQRGTG